MDITITINTDNSAFDDDAMAEVGLILIEAHRKLKTMPVDSSETLYDHNGNRVGQVEVTR